MHIFKVGDDIAGVWIILYFGWAYEFLLLWLQVFVDLLVFDFGDEGNHLRVILPYHCPFEKIVHFEETLSQRIDFSPLQIDLAHHQQGLDMVRVHLVAGFELVHGLFSEAKVQVGHPAFQKDLLRYRKCRNHVVFVPLFDFQVREPPLVEEHHRMLKVLQDHRQRYVILFTVLPHNAANEPSEHPSQSRIGLQTYRSIGFFVQSN